MEGLAPMCAKRSIPRVCQQCGSAFLAAKSDVANGWGRFCSVRCSLLARPKTPLLTRALSKIEYMTDGCWRWTDCLHYSGYGRITVDGKVRYAHRVVYELLIGPIPDDLELDHLCRNRACVNPQHLEPVPHRENVIRGVHPLAQIHRSGYCKNGHPINVETRHVFADGSFGSCKLCRKERRQKGEWR